MGKDVQNTLEKIINNKTNKNNGHEYMTDLKKNNRYIAELWST